MWRSRSGDLFPAPVWCLGSVGLIAEVGRGSGLVLDVWKVVLDALMRDATSMTVYGMFIFVYTGTTREVGREGGICICLDWEGSAQSVIERRF